MKVLSTLLIVATVAFSGITTAQEVKPVPEREVTTKLVKLHVVSGDHVTTTIVQVDGELFDKLPISDKASLSAASYRLKADHTVCEAFSTLGTAMKVSPTQIAIVLDASAKSSSHLLAGRLNTPDPLSRHAILLLPAKADDSKLAFTGKSISEFASSLQPRIDDGGLIAYPIETGVSPLAVTCTCKSFFGCTSGCCTSVTCNVVVGFCQDNPNCKKVDLTSNCSCDD